MLYTKRDKYARFGISVREICQLLLNIHVVYNLYHVCFINIQ